MTYRYGSREMRLIWSEENKHLLARDIWIAVAEAQMEAGIVSPIQLSDLKKNRDNIDINIILTREMDRDDPKFVGHETVAAISHFKDLAKIGGEIIHQGMTSADLWSNVEPLLIKESLVIIDQKVVKVLAAFSEKIDRYKGLTCVGWTHLQPAEPTTVGYRLARYAQDLLSDLTLLRFVEGQVKAKGLKGAVGTSASFDKLLENTKISVNQHEQAVLKKIGIDAVAVAGQTYPRKYLMWTLHVLSSIAQTAHQFAADVKILQSPAFGEWAQPISGVGSSAMPHKVNPSTLESIKSLARAFPGVVAESWHTAAEVTLERGLEDSARKRSYLPESFLIIDEVISRLDWIVTNLEVHEEAINRNMEKFGPFMALEIILSEIAKRGGDRQKIHHRLNKHARTAWQVVQEGKPNPLNGLVAADELIVEQIPSREINVLFDSIDKHTGLAAQRCKDFLKNQLSSVNNN